MSNLFYFTKLKLLV